MERWLSFSLCARSLQYQLSSPILAASRSGLQSLHSLRSYGHISSYSVTNALQNILMILSTFKAGWHARPIRARENEQAEHSL